MTWDGQRYEGIVALVKELTKESLEDIAARLWDAEDLADRRESEIIRLEDEVLALEASLEFAGEAAAGEDI